MGLGVLSDKPFLEAIDLAFPHIRDILDEMCEDEKNYMKALTRMTSWGVGLGGSQHVMGVGRLGVISAKIAPSS